MKYIYVNKKYIINEINKYLKETFETIQVHCLQGWFHFS